MANVELLLIVGPGPKGTVTAKIDADPATGLDEAEDQWEWNDDPLLRETAQIMDQQLRRGILSRRDEFRVLGTHLYRILFMDEKGRAFFEQALKAAGPERLRVQLSFREGTEQIAGLPWEYLHSPGTNQRVPFFFSIDTSLVLSRFLSLTKGRTASAPTDPPLRILVVPSQPSDLTPVASEQLINAIGRASEKYPIELDTLEDPTTERFLDRLGDSHQPPHVIHFIGHGRFKDPHYYIAFLSPENGQAVWWEAEQFARNFVEMKAHPSLVFLHLCPGGPADGPGDDADVAANFARVAPYLIQVAEIPAVVAMQHPIPKEAGVSFTRAFYGELAKGEPIDNAVQVGRWRITVVDPALAETRVWGTPVLYMRSRGGPLVKRAGVGTGPTASAGRATGDGQEGAVSTATRVEAQGGDVIDPPAGGFSPGSGS
jgi:CHAT domain